MRAILNIVIHCSASPNGRTLFSGTAGKPGFSTPAAEINRWHKARGFHRHPAFLKRQEPSLCCIGYHFVVGTNGAVFNGRHLDEIGAHAQGFNRDSIGICLVGTDAFSIDQWNALSVLVSGLVKTHQGASVLGHRDLPKVAKSCPGFSVRDWLDNGMKPLDGHILVEAGNAA